MTGDVQRLLVTGAETELMAFHGAVGMLLNGIDRWEQTVFYTCLPEHYEAARQLATALGLTVQRWQDGDWPIVVQGSLPGWSAEPEPLQETTDDHR